MGVLKIQCYCNEEQMTQAVNLVSNEINMSNLDEIFDIDEPVGDILASVSFGTIANELCIEVAEIINTEWDTLIEDSAVFRSRLEPIVAEYNRQNKEAMAQENEIRRDRHTY